VQLAEEDELLAHGHLAIEPALLRQVADAVEVGARARMAEHADLAPVGADDVHQHPQRGRLARAVGTEQTEDGARRHRERDVVDGHRAAEALPQTAQLERGFHQVLRYEPMVREIPVKVARARRGQAGGFAGALCGRPREM
jgi:hypothetical protein